MVWSWSWLPCLEPSAAQAGSGSVRRLDFGRRIWTGRRQEPLQPSDPTGGGAAFPFAGGDAVLLAALAACDCCLRLRLRRCRLPRRESGLLPTQLLPVFGAACRQAVMALAARRIASWWGTRTDVDECGVTLWINRTAEVRPHLPQLFPVFEVGRCLPSQSRRCFLASANGTCAYTEMSYR